MSEELCSKVDSMFLENLEEWILEEDKVVTYKYLSKALKCHVNVAKQMLFNFVQQEQEKGNKDLGIVYLVSGFVKSDEGPTKLKVVLIEENDMEKQTNMFEKVLTKHIYSVQKHKKISSTALFATDIMSLREDIYSCNAQNAIKNKAAVPRPSEAINQLPGPSKDVKPVIKKEPTSATSIFKPKLETKKPSPKKVSPSKTNIKKEDSSKKTGSAGKKTGGNIASMFAKQAAKPKEVKPKEELTSNTSPGKENLENARIEEEKKSESAEKKKNDSASKVSASKTSSKAGSKNKKNSSSKDANKKRKRIQVQSDSDDSDGEGEVERPPSEDEAPPQTRIIESDDEEIPSTPQPEKKTSQGGGRRRVRKEVDKTYMDSKGFMVTKKEYVYESEDEPAEEPETKPPSAVKKTSPAAADKAAPVAKKAKLMAAGGAKQPGIMRFFKKK